MISGSPGLFSSLNGQSQTYRILNASGGRPLLCSRYDAQMDPKEMSTESEVPKFEILSYFYGFDGKELGACQQFHTTKSYDGNKAITSLPCVPIRYSKHSRGVGLRDFFIGRGKRFLELTRQAEVSKRISPPTPIKPPHHHKKPSSILHHDLRARKPHLSPHLPLSNSFRREGKQAMAFEPIAVTPQSPLTLKLPPPPGWTPGMISATNMPNQV